MLLSSRTAACGPARGRVACCARLLSLVCRDRTRIECRTYIRWSSGDAVLAVRHAGAAAR
jgi:hypothetical protein